MHNLIDYLKQASNMWFLFIHLCVTVQHVEQGASAELYDVVCDIMQHGFLEEFHIFPKSW